MRVWNGWLWLPVVAIGVQSFGCKSKSSTNHHQLPVAEKPVAIRNLVVAPHLSLLLTSKPELLAWGINRTGALGTGALRQDSNQPKILEGADFIDVSAGGSGRLGNTVCARTARQSTYCWGHPGLLIGRTQPLLVPTEIPELSGVVQLAMYAGHACALNDKNEVLCWGNNFFGQLGTGHTIPESKPVVVGGLEKSSAIAVGDSHSCAIDAEKKVWCWGRNRDGEVDPSSHLPKLPQLKPTKVAEVGSALQLQLGTKRSCVLNIQGEVDCWGQGNLQNQVQKLKVPFSNKIVSLVGWGKRTCILSSKGEIANFTGNLDNIVWKKVPAFADNLAHLACSETHTCASTKDGHVWCWGVNQFGELGDGTQRDHDQPVEIGFLKAGHWQNKDQSPVKLPVTIQEIPSKLPSGCSAKRVWNVAFPPTKVPRTFAITYGQAILKTNHELLVYLSDYPLVDNKPLSEQWPRGDHHKILLRITKVEDPLAMRKKPDWLDPGRYPLLATNQKRFSKVRSFDRYVKWGEVTNYRDEGKADNHIELTYVGDDWVCGSIKIVSKVGNLEGPWMAKVYKEKVTVSSAASSASVSVVRPDPPH
jgi:hypothetical protein